MLKSFRQSSGTTPNAAALAAAAQQCSDDARAARAFWPRFGRVLASPAHAAVRSERKTFRTKRVFQNVPCNCASRCRHAGRMRTLVHARSMRSQPSNSVQAMLHAYRWRISACISSQGSAHICRMLSAGASSMLCCVLWRGLHALPPATMAAAPRHHYTTAPHPHLATLV